MKKKIILILILTTIFVPTFLVIAADDLSYTVLAPLPGTTDCTLDDGTTIQAYECKTTPRKICSRNV